MEVKCGITHLQLIVSTLKTSDVKHFGFQVSNWGCSPLLGDDVKKEENMEAYRTAVQEEKTAKMDQLCAGSISLDVRGLNLTC